MWLIIGLCINDGIPLTKLLLSGICKARFPCFSSVYVNLINNICFLVS